MTIHYDSNTDMLYLRLEQQQQTVTNKRVTEDIVLDMGENDKIVGIEIMDASKHINLEALFPINYSKAV